MRLEDMKDTFPKMPEDIKNMIEKEVAVQIKSRQEESIDTENARQSGKKENKENAKVIKYRKKKKDAALPGLYDLNVKIIQQKCPKRTSQTEQQKQNETGHCWGKYQRHGQDTIQYASGNRFHLHHQSRKEYSQKERDHSSRETCFQRNP